MQTSDWLLLTWPLSLLFLMGLVIFYVVRTLRASQQILVEALQNLIQSEQQENQRLRNQLLSREPMTLMAMNQATGLTSDEGQEHLPFSIDEGLAYAQHLQANGLAEGLVSDELSAAGWETTVVPATEAEYYGGIGDSDAGGSPVVFGQ